MARKTKEESQKTRDGILDAAERVFLEKGVGTTAMADLADAAGVSRGAVYGHYKNKIEVCLAMCDRAFGQIEVPDENARVPALDILLRAGMGFLRQCCEPGSVQRVLDILLRAGMGFLRQCCEPGSVQRVLDILLRAGMGFLRQCCEPGSVQRVLEILYLKCERSDENEPLLRRRELLEKQGQRFGLRQIRRAVERGELPARLDVELASIYLQSLWDGICGTLAWTERLRDDPWNRAERMFRAGLDSLRSSPYLLLADA
ncbi:TetR family transcriptional regulator [Pseudomonas aeruginosa]|nr:TetR family transcriptional regulator [Pseudomonas aeruginosa]